MKKILFTLLIFLLTAEAFSQSVTDLERDPSFKGITIGAPISKYSDILSFSHTSQGKMSIVLVKVATCPSSILGCKI